MQTESVMIGELMWGIVGHTVASCELGIKRKLGEFSLVLE